MRKRLEYQGGIRQEDRMIKDKYRTFLKTLQYSYQSCDVQLIQKYQNCEQLQNEIEYRALINPDKVKQDYDDKILSIDYAYNYEPGDVFKWLNTNTYWLIYLQALTEDAYFRGEIRRCKYQINFKDKDNQLHVTWAAIRGPVETQIESIQKNEIRIDRPNYGLNILMPLNEYTLQAFQRYSKFLFADKAWQVQAVDSISIKNVLEVNAEEYYINRDTDDIENEIANGLIVLPVEPEDDLSGIQGNIFIKPLIEEVYSAKTAGTWSIKNGDNCPITFSPIDEYSVKITWNKTTSGSFILQHNEENTILEKKIIVDSLF